MIKLLLCLVASPWVLWVFYTAIMRLKQVRDAGHLTPAMKAFGYPALLVGLVIDFVVNLVVASLLFAERPREWTLSSRLWRLSNDAGAGWRRRIALAIRTALLDSIDPSGVHRG